MDFRTQSIASCWYIFECPIIIRHSFVDFRLQQILMMHAIVHRCMGGPELIAATSQHPQQVPHDTYTQEFHTFAPTRDSSSTYWKMICGRRTRTSRGRRREREATSDLSSDPLSQIHANTLCVCNAIAAAFREPSTHRATHVELARKRHGG